MGGDYTRFTFDPVKEFSGVRKQQGRVSLDSDFNEFEAILDRRRRAQMHDTVGSVGRAVVPMTTPDGFKIGLSGTQLSIGVGRAYADGILAECFGDMGPGQKIDRDDVLGGVRGAAPLPYERQPFYYAGYPGLVTTAGAINTVYLDVWQREVTVFEDDALREPALNGPDTATRVQTAWQVKVLGHAATSSNCAHTPPGWAALTAPSTARLTAKADGVLAPPPGPCEINPSGGYTGLENRLYRVEVHSDGTVGGPTRATFKWSRDNASLAARVTAVAQAGARWAITVNSTGPDGWARFSDGDHLELIDDDIEFAMREKGRGGLMMKVVSADHANEVLVVDANLGAFTLRPDRHPRIRRWDRPANSSTEPLLRAVSAGVAEALEDGIKITFDGAATDTLRAGDYWVFEARTSTGKIGKLVNAPPRGPLHHFAKLGYVTIGQQPTDCRVFWPPVFVGGGGGEGCCTVVVKPGDDIQAAIGSLAGKGGCVCLKMGDHAIAQPLQITQDNITLHAEAPLVTVRLAGGGPLVLSVMGARNVNVLGIRFEVKDGSKGGAMVALEGVRGGRIAGCSLGFIGGAADPAWKTIGLRLENCDDYVIEDNAIERVAIGIDGQECDRVRIIGNTLSGVGVGDGNTRRSAGTMGIVFADTVGVAVERNLVADYRRGIQIGELAASAALPPLDLGRIEPGCRIVANVISRQGGGTLDNLAAASNTKVIAFAIAARMPRCEILENAVRLGSNADGGILADCGHVEIARNLLSSTADFSPAGGRVIVPRGVVAAVRDSDALACDIRDNLFTGLQQAVFVSGTGENKGALRRVEVVSNHVAGSPELFKALLTIAGNVGASPQALLALLEALATIAVTNVRSARVADNEISSVVCAVTCTQVAATVVQGNTITLSLAGVVLALAADCEVADNIIDQAMVGVLAAAAQSCVVQRNALTRTMLGISDVAGTGTRIQDNDLSGGSMGISLFATADAEVRGNTIQDAARIGIVALVPQTAVTLAHNKVLRCGYQADATATVLTAGIMVVSSEANVFIESCHAIDIGVSAEATDPVFLGARLGISVRSRHGRARVHGCTITSPSIAEADAGPGPNPASRALLIMVGQPPKPSGVAPPKPDDKEFISEDDASSIDCADASDNLAEQTATPVVEIVTEGEVIFATNRCRRLDAPDGRQPAVSLRGSCLVVTGNRVHALGGGPSVELMATRALTAVGNMTTNGATISGAPPIPAPYNDFNART